MYVLMYVLTLYNYCNYTYVYMYMYVHIYIYIYTQRSFSARQCGNLGSTAELEVALPIMPCLQDSE